MRTLRLPREVGHAADDSGLLELRAKRQIVRVAIAQSLTLLIAIMFSAVASTSRIVTVTGSIKVRVWLTRLHLALLLRILVRVNPTRGAFVVMRVRRFCLFPRDSHVGQAIGRNFFRTSFGSLEIVLQQRLDFGSILRAVQSHQQLFPLGVGRLVETVVGRGFASVDHFDSHVVPLQAVVSVLRAKGVPLQAHLYQARRFLVAARVKILLGAVGQVAFLGVLLGVVLRVDECILRVA